MTRYYSDAEIIKMSLILYPEEMQRVLRQDAQVLMAAVHDWNSEKRPRFRPMFGESMAYELLYGLGRFLNREYPLEK